jgi:uncharacterized YccA/Bax inhibitor family protein
MQSNNPAFNQRTLDKMRTRGAFTATGRMMTVEGTINKVGILVTLTVLSAIASWSYGASDFMLISIAGIIGFILSFVIIFKMQWAPTIAPLYAICEGIVLGFLSSMMNTRYPGVVFNAFVLTFGILFMMLLLYRFKIIQATQRFRMGMAAAFFALIATYLVDFLLGIFGHPMAMMHQYSSMAYGIFSIAVIVMASLSFILDFDMIERASAARAPSYMEWYGGFAVLLTIIWLYVSILRYLNRGRD